MKKFAVLLVLFCSTFSVYSQEVKAGETVFEQVLLQKGVLIIKEFIPFSKFNKIDGEIAVLTDINSGTKTFALRLTTSYYRSTYDSGETTGVFDSKEISSALQAIDFMIKKIAEIPLTAPYTEIIYRGNGEPEFGFYALKADRKAWFTVSDKATVFFDVSQLELLKQFFISAKEKIISLGGKID